MAPLAELLRTTITGTLEKLIQPAGLVPGAVLVLLNLGFIVPAAEDAGVDAATAYTSLSDTWRAVVAATAVMLVGLVLLSSAQTVIGFYSGYGWRGSILSTVLVGREQSRARRFAESPDFDQLTRLWELERRFDVDGAAVASNSSDRKLLSNVQPTAMGNVLRAIQKTVSRRHGIDLTVLTNHINATKEVKDSRSAAVLQEERVSFDLFSNLAFAFLIFGAEATVFFSTRQAWSDALSAAAALGASYLAYRIAVGRARSWGDALEALVDLYVDDLAAQLNLRATVDTADRRSLWERVSRFYRPGGREDPRPIFDVPDKPVEILAINLEVEEKDEVVEPAEMHGVEVVLRAIVYEFALRRVSEGEASLVLRDPRLGQEANLQAAREPTRIPSAVGSVYKWHFTSGEGPAGALIASAPLWTLRSESAVPLHVQRLESGYFRVTRAAPVSGLRLETMAVRVIEPQVWLANDKLDVRSERERYFVVNLPHGDLAPLYVRLPALGEETLWLAAVGSEGTEI